MSDEIRRLGERYELGEVIGRGGMAEVHEGRDLRLQRRVAVKILRPDLARDPSFQARFRREAQSAASLNHPNVVAVYDTGEDVLGEADGRGAGTVVPYIVMEYVDGMTLRQLMASGRRLLPERALEITSGVLAALDYSHRHGIIHRDIKPANVMLTRGGDVKVMDFGIARAIADAGQTMTQQSAVLGTAHYLSPEQARGEVVDSRSDLYSTGCLVYELLTGRPPFTGDSPVSIAYQHVSETAVPPSQLDPSVPLAVDTIVMTALAKNPAERYQTAAEMRIDVDRAVAGLPVTAPVPITTLPAQPTEVLAAVGVGATVAAQEPTSGRGPAFWVLLTLGVLAIGVAALLVGKAVFGSPAVEQVVVPNLSGLELPAAQNALIAQGLVLGQQTPQASDTIPSGRIISQTPPPGDQAAKASKVDVTVSTGKDKTSVPSLVGLTSQDQARAALVDANLVLGKVTPVDSDQPAGAVVAQGTPAATLVDAGTAVTISISNGQVKVPDVTNESEAQARSDLINAGFEPNVIKQEDATATPGTVLAQSPKGGASAVKGTQVTITVAVAPPTPTPTPTPTPPPPTPTPATT